MLVLQGPIAALASAETNLGCSLRSSKTAGRSLLDVLGQSGVVIPDHNPSDVHLVALSYQRRRLLLEISCNFASRGTFLCRVLQSWLIVRRQSGTDGAALTAAEPSKRTMGQQPFIMPDGRPLGAFLNQDGAHAGADAGRRRGSAKGRKHGGGKQQHWERTFRSSAPHAAGGAPTSEADQIELEVPIRSGSPVLHNASAIGRPVATCNSNQQLCEARYQ